MGEVETLISEILHRTLPTDRETYTSLYAYWYESTVYSKTFWYYAIGFCEECFYAILLSFSNEKIGYSQPILIKKKKLALINDVKNDGSINFVSFYDEEHREVLSIWLEQHTVKLGSTSPAKIHHEEEARTFMEMIY